ncbi:hypothetical protein Tco_0438728 [Tanacetum coccineum]
MILSLEMRVPSIDIYHRTRNPSMDEKVELQYKLRWFSQGSILKVPQSMVDASLELYPIPYLMLKLLFLNEIDRKSLGKTFKETPAGSGVPVYAMEPAVLPPQLEWLNALPERDLFSRIRVLEGRDYYNLPPPNNPGEYEGLVREHLAQAIDRPHRQEILKSEGVEIGILERKGILQNQLLVLMRNEKNILDSYSTRTGAELLTFLGPSLRQGAALLFPPFPRV